MKFRSRVLMVGNNDLSVPGGSRLERKLKFTDLLVREGDLCREFWQECLSEASDVNDDRLKPKQEGHNTCPYAFTRLRKNLALITSNCLMFATK